ncbi:hypothetical protein NFC73_17425 [Pseudarthrobacter sp. RMG13]|uniref:Uncharacterized protein n=1 Tax=Pseudarthrobacter humi TaxID=2952523 RepID=A0ABT1LSU3_9MICC|nr:hypothetical protein [Pseudarthrobacter humi]MCP9001492.1 hypothetical protein [Pseudarthrobacter humi]
MDLAKVPLIKFLAHPLDLDEGNQLLVNSYAVVREILLDHVFGCQVAEFVITPWLLPLFSVRGNDRHEAYFHRRRRWRVG